MEENSWDQVSVNFKDLEGRNEVGSKTPTSKYEEVEMASWCTHNNRFRLLGLLHHFYTKHGNFVGCRNMAGAFSCESLWLQTRPVLTF